MPAIAPSRVVRLLKIHRIITGKKLLAAKPKAKPEPEAEPPDTRSPLQKLVDKFR